MSYNFLDKTGLAHFWEKIKAKIPTKTSQLTNDSGYTTNTGTVTSVAVKMNNTTKGTVTKSGTIDLGTVITSHQSLADRAVNKTLTNENLNNITTPGFYNAGGSNSVTNKPSGVDHFGLYVVHGASGSYYTQRIFNDTTQYRRKCVNGTWGSWSEDKLTDTTYSNKTASSGGTDVSLVTTGEKYTWNNKTSNKGTVTSVAVKMNNTTKGTVTTSGTIDLGTVITAHQDISGLAPKASPALTGTPTAPTATSGTNTTQIATTAFVQTAVSGKQNTLATQTAYTSKGSATKVPQITTNTLGQVTGIKEVTITHPTVDSTLNSTSTNAIQNKAVNSAITDISRDVAQFEEDITEDLTTKVDKVTGKGLSTNDYTTDEKTLLENLGNYVYTTEKAIGTWSGGSTIYRKTIDTTKANLATTINAMGINILIDMHLMIESKYSATLPIPSYFTEAGYQTMMFQNKTTKAFTFNFGNYYEDTSRVYGWVEYTKTST